MICRFAHVCMYVMLCMIFMRAMFSYVCYVAVRMCVMYAM